MAIDRERMLDIVGLEQRLGGLSGLGGFNFLGIPSGGGGGFVTQEPQLGPDEFGSYSIPVSDPTYRSGFDYARSIAGGMPMSQVIAPGVSYSPEQPMGYTQEQLNTAVGTTPVEPPQGTPSPYGVFADDPRYFGTGIGGVTIFDDKDPKAIEHRDIITGKIIGKPLLPPRRDDFMSIGGPGGGLPDSRVDEGVAYLGGSPTFNERYLQESVEAGNALQDFINKYQGTNQQGMRFDPITRKMVPVEGPDMTGKIIGNNAIPPIPPKINDQIFIDDRPIIDERMIDRGYGPGIMPPLPPMDIDKLIPPTDLPPINITDLPPINIMDLPPVDLPPINIPPRIPLDLPIVRPPTIMDKPRTIDRQTIMDELTGGRFSINQKRPMGLF